MGGGRVPGIWGNEPANHGDEATFQDLSQGNQPALSRPSQVPVTLIVGGCGNARQEEGEEDGTVTPRSPVHDPTLLDDFRPAPPRGSGGRLQFYSAATEYLEARYSKRLA